MVVLFSSSISHTAFQIACRSRWTFITKDDTDMEETINANIWPNVITLDLVGLAITVDRTHIAVGPNIKYVNLKTGALSMIFDQRLFAFSLLETEGLNDETSHAQNHHKLGNKQLLAHRA
jgi:hypothetical protein